MSSLLLEGHHLDHTIQDDMESLILVVIYYSLRYLPHNESEGAAYIIDIVFNHRVQFRTGEYKGGEARKYLFLCNGYIGNRFKLKSPPLQRWVQVAIKALREWIDGEIAKSEPTIASEEPKRTGKQLVAAICSALPIKIPSTDKSPRTLDDHREMAEFFAGCFEAEDWPALADDKPHDILSDAKPRTSFRTLVKRSKPSSSRSWSPGSETKRWSQLRIKLSLTFSYMLNTRMICRPLHDLVRRNKLRSLNSVVGALTVHKLVYSCRWIRR